MAAEAAAPTTMAMTDQRTPSRRWTRSRSVKPTPAASTPEGAMMPGQTGITHGPPGTQVVPTWPTR